MYMTESNDLTTLRSGSDVFSFYLNVKDSLILLDIFLDSSLDN